MLYSYGIFKYQQTLSPISFPASRKILEISGKSLPSSTPKGPPVPWYLGSASDLKQTNKQMRLNPAVVAEWLEQ